MKTTAFLHTASFFHLACLNDPFMRAAKIKDVYLPDYTGDFSEFDSIYIAARTHPRFLIHHKDNLLNFLSCAGKKMYVDGVNHVNEWLHNDLETPRGTNFWAWRTGEDLGRYSVNTAHPAWKYLRDEAVHWHYHGVLDTPTGATTLVELREVQEARGAHDPWGQEYGALPNHANALLYYDHASYPAELIVSTMDATYHHGAGFMPGATQLFYSMMLWLRD